MISKLHVSQIRIHNDIPEDNYIADLSVVKNIQKMGWLKFEKPVSFFIGENGIGKSTLIEAIAVNLGFNPEGGSINFNFSTQDSHSELYKYMTVAKGCSHRRDGYFLRAESFYNVASNIDEIEREIERNCGKMLQSYGGKSLHKQSHGESFMALVENRFGGNGIYILDEPEAALSPARLMKLMIYIKQLEAQNCQFIISTHSPILMTYPDADIFYLTEDKIEKVKYYETEHYQITKQFLDQPERMLHYLMEDSEEE